MTRPRQLIAALTAAAVLVGAACSNTDDRPEPIDRPPCVTGGPPCPTPGR